MIPLREKWHLFPSISIFAPPFCFHFPLCLPDSGGLFGVSPTMTHASFFISTFRYMAYTYFKATGENRDLFLYPTCSCRHLFLPKSLTTSYIPLPLHRYVSLCLLMNCWGSRIETFTVTVGLVLTVYCSCIRSVEKDGIVGSRETWLIRVIRYGARCQGLVPLAIL